MMEEPEITGRPANKMPFMDAMKSGVANSFSLSGRSSRSEYWWFVLGGNLAFMLSVILAGAIHSIFMILPILLMPAAITLVVRRLHDVGKSGWWWFISFVPLVGVIYLIYLFVQEGDAGGNMYGSVPTNMLE